MHRQITVTALTVSFPVVLVCLLASACGTRKAPRTDAVQPAPAPAAAPTTSGGGATGAHSSVPAPAPLVGHVTRASLEGYETWKALRAEDYTPAPAAVKTIRSRGHDVRVLVILGTWCKDSKRDVPRFFKIFDQARLKLDKVTMVAVDRSKKDAEGLTARHQIQRVPTFVFFRGDREIGRVTEKPVTTLENDIASILSK
jgi:hypothetical protein